MVSPRPSLRSAATGRCGLRRSDQRLAQGLLVSLLLALSMRVEDTRGSKRLSTSLPQPTSSPPPLPRLLVCIAAHRAPGQSAGHLARVLAEAASYRSAFSVTVAVDTNSAELAAWVEGESPAAGFASARVWLSEELGDPLHLPNVHRHLMQARSSEFELFLYVEDDVLIPLRALSAFVAAQGELWERGWTYAWVRAELWRADNATAVSVDNIEPVQDPRVWRTPSGALYAEPWSPYAAAYALTRGQLEAMVRDASRVWYDGFPPFLPRERVAIGWAYARTGSTADPAPYGAVGWRARALVPITPNGTVHPDALVWHLPQKYAVHAPLFFKDLGAVPVADVFAWTQGVPESQPLLHLLDVGLTS